MTFSAPFGPMRRISLVTAATNRSLCKITPLLGPDARASKTRREGRDSPPRTGENTGRVGRVSIGLFTHYGMWFLSIGALSLCACGDRTKPVPPAAPEPWRVPTLTKVRDVREPSPSGGDAWARYASAKAAADRRREQFEVLVARLPKVSGQERDALRASIETTAGVHETYAAEANAWADRVEGK